MDNITWLKLNGDQECSYRLGFDKEFESKLTAVCCIQVYNIAWDAIKEMVKSWNYIDRQPHYDELCAVWYNHKLNKPFRQCYYFTKIVREAKLKIRKFYIKHLNREPEHCEMMAAFRQAFINPDFVYDWKIKSRKKDGNCTKNYLRINFSKRERRDCIKLVDKVEVGKCIYCGHPVFTYDNNLILAGAGTIEMSFGYGSQLDCHHGTGYIHDICAARLDQAILYHRLDWGEHDNKYEIDLRKSNKNKLKFVEVKKQK